VGGFNEYSSQEISQTLGSFNNETAFQGDNLVAQPNKVRCLYLQGQRYTTSHAQ
jgi:hypothetical protein